MDWEIIKGILPLLSPFYERAAEIGVKSYVSCNLRNNFLRKNASIKGKIAGVQLVLRKAWKPIYLRNKYSIR